MSGSNYMAKLLDGVEVEWKSFGDVAKVQRGASPRPIAKYITEDENGIPWIKIGDTSSGLKYVKKTAQRITPDGAKKSRILKKGDFILSNSMSFGRPYILDINGAIHDGWASISDFSEHLNSDYLYHFLSSKNVQNYWVSKINSGSVSNLNADLIKALLIPIPSPENPKKSLEIQAEIVRILDTFTELTAELTTELIARKKQYNYYRDQLLTEVYDSTKEFTIGEVLDMRAGKNIKAEDIAETETSEHKYACYGGNGSRGFVSNYSHDGNYVLIGRQGALCGNVKRAKGKFYATEHAVACSPKDGINIDWVFYMLTFMNLNQYKSKSAQPGLAVGNIAKLRIKVPPFEEQARIVSILDKFDTLTNSISEGLPREIELRQQQYEYYRDLLLSFPKPDSEVAA